MPEEKTAQKEQDNESKDPVDTEELEEPEDLEEPERPSLSPEPAPSPRRVLFRLTDATRRNLWTWGLIVLIGFVLLLGRVIWSSHEEVELGRAAYERGEREEAVFHLKHAAHWYLPGNPYVSEALEELRQIARQAEMEGQSELALAAYRAIRTSSLGSRSFFTPHSSQLEEANQRIAHLLARQSAAPMDSSKTVAQRREIHEALLSRVEEPSHFWSIVSSLGFIVWILAAIGFITRGLDDELHLKGQAALRWSLTFIIGFMAWVLGLNQA